VSFLPEDFYSLDLLVVPMWGLYANMLAQLISQVSSHFIIHYHRCIIENATRQYKLNNCVAAGQATAAISLKDVESRAESTLGAHKNNQVSEYHGEEKLCEHTFARPHRGEQPNAKLVARRVANPLIMTVSLACCLFIIVGCSIPSMSMEVLGIVGLLVESGQGFVQAKTYYSLFTMFSMLFGQADFRGQTADYVGLGSLSMFLVCTVLLVPVVQVGLLLWQWFCPMNQKRRDRVSLSIEILHSWQYADVFLFAIVVGCW
jgi:hypothetical protein